MKKHISKKNTKKRRNYNKRKTGKKNCGCKSNIFLSMKKKLIGGNINPASFQNFESTKDQYYYDVNTYNNDPNNPNLLVSTRTLPNFVGGKKNKTTRKIKGGSDFIPSFGNLSGSKIGATIFSGEQLIDPSPISQPAYSINSGSYKMYV
jgi:hypothetical protein